MLSLPISPKAIGSREAVSVAESRGCPPMPARYPVERIEVTDVISLESQQCRARAVTSQTSSEPGTLRLFIVPCALKHWLRERCCDFRENPDGGPGADFKESTLRPSVCRPAGAWRVSET